MKHLYIVLAAISACVILGGERLYAKSGIHAVDEPYVVLNNRKLYTGDSFSLLTDCGYFRFMVSEINPVYFFIRIKYPRTLSGYSPRDMRTHLFTKESEEQYEGLLTIGESCFVMNACPVDTQKICFNLRKTAESFALSYNQKKVSVIIPQERVPQTAGPAGEPRQRLQIFEEEKKEEEKKKDTYSPQEWFVF